MTVCTPHLSLWRMISEASCEHNNVTKKTPALKHAALSQELLLLNRNCLIHGALFLVPISAPHAAQKEMRVKKKNERIYFHVEIFSKALPCCITSAKPVLNVMASPLRPLSSAWLSLRFKLGISQGSTACTAPSPRAALRLHMI